MFTPTQQTHRHARCNTTWFNWSKRLPWPVEKNHKPKSHAHTHSGDVQQKPVIRIFQAFTFTEHQRKVTKHINFDCCCCNCSLHLQPIKTHSKAGKDNQTYSKAFSINTNLVRQISLLFLHELQRSNYQCAVQENGQRAQI